MSKLQQAKGVTFLQQCIQCRSCRFSEVTTR